MKLTTARAYSASSAGIFLTAALLIVLAWSQPEGLMRDLGGVLAGGMWFAAMAAAVMAWRTHAFGKTAPENIKDALAQMKGWVPAALVSRQIAQVDDGALDKEDAGMRALQVSALAETSAAMMLADTDFKITFVNKATMDLLSENETEIQKAVPKFRADRILGEQMDIFHSSGNRARKYLSDPANLPFNTDIQVGPLWFSLKIVSAKDASGSHGGFVVEWNEVTELRRNRAIRETLESGQILCELSPDGQMEVVNENFRTLMGVADAGHLKFDSMLKMDLCDTPPAWDSICRGETAVGRYAFRAADGATVWIDASFSAVKDQTGAVVNVLLIGNDVTEAETSRLQFDAERKKAKEEVETVVDTLREALSRLAGGDLTSTISTAFAPAYEPIRQSFNAAVDELAEAISFVDATVATLGQNSGVISQSTLTLSRTTEQQAAALEETAAALDEMTASVKSAATSAEDAKSEAEKTKNLAVSSGLVVEKAIAAMRSIEASAEKISHITKVIDDISFQTNLLALNAGVEAARAGDAGRGFSVVASEVRGLAQRSAENATEIKQLIDESTASVSSGSVLVKETGEALKQIIEAMQAVDKRVGDIAQSSVEQSTGLNEINTAVNQLGNANQEFAASFEETTASTQEMTADVQRLQARIQEFEIGTKSHDRARPQRVEDMAPAVQPFQKKELKVVGGDTGWEEF